jgi:hypothetical protein
MTPLMTSLITSEREQARAQAAAERAAKGRMQTALDEMLAEGKDRLRNEVAPRAPRARPDGP